MRQVTFGLIASMALVLMGLLPAYSADIAKIGIIDFQRVLTESDAGQAVTFLAEQAEKFDLNRDKLALWAFSGAGMLLRPFLSGEYTALRGLVAFYPLLDLTHIPQAADVYSDDELIALSPLSVVDRVETALPLYVVRAGRDRPGLNRALDTFIKQALYHNLNLETRNLPQAGHGFDMLEDSAAGRMAIARGFEFAAANLHED